MDREINGLKEAMLELGLIDGLILTLDQEDEIQDTSINMKLMPVWKWMN
jgi:predicted AAA+ superfamily ATPase